MNKFIVDNEWTGRVDDVGELVKVFWFKWCKIGSIDEIQCGSDLTRHWTFIVIQGVSKAGDATDNTSGHGSTKSIIPARCNYYRVLIIYVTNRCAKNRYNVLGTWQQTELGSPDVPAEKLARQGGPALLCGYNGYDIIEGKKLQATFFILGVNEQPRKSGEGKQQRQCAATWRDD